MCHTEPNAIVTNGGTVARGPTPNRLRSWLVPISAAFRPYTKSYQENR